MSIGIPLLLLLAMLAACDERAGSPPSEAAAGAEFEDLQVRGQVAMGVDQYTSTHLFDSRPDGGRIELQRDVNDPEGVEAIRDHLRHTAGAFQQGDFSVPGFVHAREVPGTATMAAKKDRIEYTYSDLPRGGQVLITTTDPEAIAAIHEFMAFQRMDHRAGGHAH